MSLPTVFPFSAPLANVASVEDVVQTTLEVCRDVGRYLTSALVQLLRSNLMIFSMGFGMGFPGSRPGKRSQKMENYQAINGKTHIFFRLGHFQ